MNSKRPELCGIYTIRGAPVVENQIKCLSRQDSVQLHFFYLRFTALGLRPQTPGEAPPMAGFNIKSVVAYQYPQITTDDIILNKAKCISWYNITVKNP